MKNIPFLSLCILTLQLCACQHKNTQNENAPIKRIALPQPNHIVVVIEENHGYDYILASGEAPYINQLAKESAVFTNAHGVTHPSQPNYLILFSGNRQDVNDDHCLKEESPFHTPNLATALIKKGLTFKGYAQTMPSVGYTGCNFKRSNLTKGYLYARKHTPWTNWIGTGENNIPDSISLPMSEFPKNFNLLPTVSFVIPNQDYDMHNIGSSGNSKAVKRADKWLRKHIDPYVQWAEAHNSLLILTFDEDDFTNKNHIITLFYGPMIQAGHYSERIDHYNVLHTIEDLYHLPLTGASKGKIIDSIWIK